MIWVQLRTRCGCVGWCEEDGPVPEISVPILPPRERPLADDPLTALKSMASHRRRFVYRGYDENFKTPYYEEA